VQVQDYEDMAVAVADIYAARFDVPKSADWALMKLSEEQGELMGAWLAHQGQSRACADAQDVADEVADVLGFLLVFCARAGIDPARALRDKWGKYLPEET
jgi:NTP pyrophosphatase (non-canonical NTP hydrolase)